MKQKCIRLLLVISTALGLTLLTGCASMRYVNMYTGDHPDSELSGIVSGNAPINGEQWVALLVGVDGNLCPADILSSDRSPLHKNNCANLLKVLPGKRTISYVWQTPNQVKFSGTMGTNSWKRTEIYETEPVKLEAGALYIAMPVLSSSGKPSVRLDFVCLTSDFWDARSTLWSGKRPVQCP